MKTLITFTLISLLSVLASGCPLLSMFEKKDGEARQGNTVMFIGVDMSGSYVRSRDFDDSLNFLAHYLYMHINGHGKVDKLSELFVGTVGGRHQNEVKTFYPIQQFQHRSVAEIRQELNKFFPKNRVDPYTDFNAFFGHVTTTVRNRNLLLKPIEVIILSDGIPDAPKVNGNHNFRSIDLDLLENLSRRVTLRVLYTSAVIGDSWQTKIPRRRVRVWTQDATVMRGWSDPRIFQPRTAFTEQERFFSWVASNVDFSVRNQRVD